MKTPKPLTNTAKLDPTSAKVGAVGKPHLQRLSDRSGRARLGNRAYLFWVE